MPYSKNVIDVSVPHRSGFDKSHRNSGTLECGTLTPILCDEVVPGTRASLKLNVAAQLPPLVSDTYMNLKLKAEAFFVPMRLLFGSFESFFNDFPDRVLNHSGQTIRFTDTPGRVPVFYLSSEGESPFNFSLLGPGSLADYLGLRISSSYDGFISLNPLPFVAYHLIWQEYYRNPRVQNPAFSRSIGNDAYSNPSFLACSIPYTFFHDTVSSSIPQNYLFTKDSNFNLADGTSIFSTRQRNFGLDYFTGSRVSAQQGSPSSVSIAVSESSGSMSIAALRAANSLQQFRERNNIPSPRLVDQVKARYGANLSDGVAQRPICIGSATYDMYSRGVDQTAPASGAAAANPFASVGAQYGRAYGAGSDFIISDFTANEPGYIMVLLSLVPEVTYSSGVPHMFMRYTSGSITDMACALLQNVGDQPIHAYELVDSFVSGSAIFGYQDRYADFMFIPNMVHGSLRDGMDISSFVLQRTFSGSTPVLSSSFLEIPKGYLDDVLAVSAQGSQFVAWYDSMLHYKVSMPLAEFSIPSLQDPAYEHGKFVSLVRNGQIF